MAWRKFARDFREPNNDRRHGLVRFLGFLQVQLSKTIFCPLVNTRFSRSARSINSYDRTVPIIGPFLFVQNYGSARALYRRIVSRRCVVASNEIPVPAGFRVRTLVRVDDFHHFTCSVQNETSLIKPMYTYLNFEASLRLFRTIRITLYLVGGDRLVQLYQRRGWRRPL